MFSYIGGKSKIGKWIKNYVPKNIETYVEPFSGAYWVYFNLDLINYRNLKTIVYNDFNPLNANLFACVRKGDDFYNYIKNIPAQQEERFYEYQKDVFSKNIIVDVDNPDFESGLQYIYIITQVFSGSKPETSNFIDLKNKYNSKFDSFKNRLTKPRWKYYFNKITHVENMDFSEVIDKYDSKNTYFYLDPPYYNKELYYSNHDFGRNDHNRLSNKLYELEGKFGLSYYYFDDLEEWFPRNKYIWNDKEFSKSSGAKKGSKQEKGQELLIMNYDINTLEKRNIQLSMF